MAVRIPIIVVPTVTKLAPDRSGAVVVGGSHAAVFPVYLVVQSGARAAVLHDAGIGKDEAGVSGLAWAETFGMAVAAVAAASARIGDGEDMVTRGVISRANALARHCGVEVGMNAGEAADRLRLAPLPSHRMKQGDHVRSIYDFPAGKRRIVCLDSISLATWQDRGQVIACGSHGGLPTLNYTAEVRPALAIFNDAFAAAENSGTAALKPLAAEGIAAAAVSSSSARIGTGRSTLLEGILSACNSEAVALGAQVGTPALELAKKAARGGRTLALKSVPVPGI